MGLGKSLKKLAGAVSPAYGMVTGEGAMGKASRKGLFGALPRMITKSAQEGEAEGQTGRPSPGRGMLGRVAAQAAEKGGMPMSGGGKKNIAIPMSGNRAMGVLNRVTREGMAKNAPASAADRAGGMKKGGSVSASKRADGCAKKGKTKGKMV